MAPQSKPIPRIRLSILGYLLLMFCILNLGAGCLWLATHHHLVWLLGVGLAVIAGVRLACTYANQP
ncbi:MAG: hypothetical protein AB4911_13765 [Oscillochloridaceae bacterium umkhey_bin13]